MVMNRADPVWASITSHENRLRERGIDWMRLSGTLPENAKYDDRRPRGTRPVHRDGILTRAAVLKQGPGSLGRRGPMMTRRSAE
jgi:hypothetical protein